MSQKRKRPAVGVPAPRAHGMKMFSVLLTPEQYSAIAEKCKVSGLSFSGEIRNLIDKGLQK